jgi:agmatine deiminase
MRRMPAEWEPHEATWLAWPHNKSDWPGRFAPIPWVYGEIVRKLAEVEKVRILVEDERQPRKVLKAVGAKLENVELYPCPTNRVWARDFGPIFVRGKSGIEITHWRFNAWAKYDDWKKDAKVPAFLSKKLRIPSVAPGLVLEGGSIDVNGAGLMLTTEECLLSPIQARNPGLQVRDLERAFREYLGITKTIWLKNGIEGDDTHGHVDDIARFTGPKTVVAVDDESQRENHRILKAAGLEVRKLPMPKRLYFDGQLLPASYANFYIANGLVLVPTFNDPNDRVALNVLAKAFPDREVTGINCMELILGLGALHCMTQQQPSPRGSKTVA